MFNTSLGPNDLIQINLNHWGEKNTKMTHIAEYQNNLSQDPKHLRAVIARLKFPFSHHTVCAQSSSSAMVQNSLARASP